MTTVTVMPPGFTASRPSTLTALTVPRAAATLWPDTVPLAPTETVALWPAASLPEDGETVTSPIRADDSVMDHVTGPPEAVRVRVPPSGGLSTMVVGVTLSVPGMSVKVGVGALLAVLAAVLLAAALAAVLLAAGVVAGEADGPGDVLW
jgi:hypothetical protein